MSDDDVRASIIKRLDGDRRLAHSVLFKHRHTHPDAPFHGPMVDDIHSAIARLLMMAFRGAAKSTKIEEAMTIMCLLADFNNGLIIGESYDRACERLSTIKHELETNEHILEVFGAMKGPIWTENKIVLANDVCVQALGSGQSLRGTKHNRNRPDFAFLDDVEDEAAVDSKEARAKMLRWFFRVVIPGLDSTKYRIRVAATPMHVESLPMRLKASKDWVTRIYPIEYVDAEGNRRSSWPEREPLEQIDARKKSFEEQGDMIGYVQEYMCEAEAEAERVFHAHMIRNETIDRTWQATYAMIDPARTTNQATSATTGIVVWSWVKSRMVVWEASGKFLKPDEIVDEIFRINHTYNPVWIGVERDGLEEWLMQPIRQEGLKRMVMPPVKSMSAPKGKLEFIKGLQPFYNAGEVIHAGPCEDLRTQLLSFPRGRIDVPNALAYALKMRSGGPIYENFSLESVVDGLEAVRSKPIHLAINATPTMLTGILVQAIAGSVRILADYAIESPPLESLAQMIRDVRLEFPIDSFKLTAGAVHFSTYRNIGIVQAARRIPIEVMSAPDPERGRPELNSIMSRHVRQMPAFLVSSRARLVLNGLSGGFCYEPWRYGVINPDIEKNMYQVLVNGLESFFGLISLGSTESTEDDRNYSMSRDGRRYISAFRRE